MNHVTQFRSAMIGASTFTLYVREGPLWVKSGRPALRQPWIITEPRISIQ